MCLSDFGWRNTFTHKSKFLKEKNFDVCFGSLVYFHFSQMWNQNLILSLPSSNSRKILRFYYINLDLIRITTKISKQIFLTWISMKESLRKVVFLHDHWETLRGKNKKFGLVHKLATRWFKFSNNLFCSFLNPSDAFYRGQQLS